MLANGDPELGPNGLEQIDDATWAAMSFEEVIMKYVNALTPKAGGPLAPGASDYGAFTRNGMWNDGSGKSPVTSPNGGAY